MTSKIIAIAGAGMHGAVWQPLQCYLAERVVVALDMPGHGPDERDDPCLTDIPSMAAYVSSCLDHDRSESVILMGHSMGALVALAAASHQCVSAVVLLGAAAAMPVNAALLQQARDDVSGAQDNILKWGIHKSCPHAADIRAFLKPVMQDTNDMALYTDLFACNAYADAAVVARKINKPALVIAGADDKMTPAAGGEDLARLLSKGTFALLKDTGHMMQLERPDETAALVADFLSKNGV